jgi:hypothetical protein
VAISVISVRRLDTAILEQRRELQLLCGELNVAGAVQLERRVHVDFGTVSHPQGHSFSPPFFSERGTKLVAQVPGKFATGSYRDQLERQHPVERFLIFGDKDFRRIVTNHGTGHDARH